MTSSSARAEASRRNGARSRGPVSAAGKARSAQNAIRHGLRARSVLLADESAGDFAGFAAALRAELAPGRHAAGRARRAGRRRRLAGAPRRPARGRAARPPPRRRRGRCRTPGGAWRRADPRRQRTARARDALAGASTDLRWSVRSGQPLPRLGAGRAVPRAGRAPAAAGRGRRARRGRPAAARQGRPRGAPAATERTRERPLSQEVRGLRAP